MAKDLEGDAPATIAVLDVGKTNVKLHATSEGGRLVETLSVPNVTAPGPLWRFHDLTSLSAWVFEGLTNLYKRHPLAAFVAAGHGSGGMLIGSDPDAGDGTVLPMIDYEQSAPDAIRDAYAPLAGSFSDRGSAIMLGASHQARQMFWMQRAAPEAFSRARWFVCIPQYWAWRLTGVAVSETTCLSAQSHLWNPQKRQWSPIVASRGWERLMPPISKAWRTIGHVRSELARRHGLPAAMKVLTGIHDSSANFYRYQAAGLSNVAVVSTGTWIVGLSDHAPLASLDGSRGTTCNADVDGALLGGALTMGGREYSIVAGQDEAGQDARLETAAELIARGAMALPSFAEDEGLFPGSAGKGRIIGPAPCDASERKALALLYAALLTIECLDVLGARGLAVLDGSFLRDPLYASLVAAMRPNGETLFNADANGVAAGAALLVGHEMRDKPARIALTSPEDCSRQLGDLPAYAARWRNLARLGEIRYRQDREGSNA